MQEKIYTTKEVAEHLGVKQGAVWRYINEGYLKAHKIGKGSPRSHWRIKQSDLESFLGKDNE